MRTYTAPGGVPAIHYGDSMPLDIVCPVCDEEDDLIGRRADAEVHITCNGCGTTWVRPLRPACATCGGSDLQTVPLAIVEKSRGTQLSVVGLRMIQLCWSCDREMIGRWQANRPNPLMPTELPTVDPD